MLLRNSFNDVSNEIFQRWKMVIENPPKNPAICMYRRKRIFENTALRDTHVN